MYRIIAAAFMAACLMAGAASAATLENLQGQVFVDRGDGFVTADEGVVKVGDRVQVKTGRASINYGGGVVIPVRRGQTVTVSEVYGQGTTGPNTGPDALTVAGAALITAGIVCLALCRDNDRPRRPPIVPSP